MSPRQRRCRRKGWRGRRIKNELAGFVFDAMEACLSAPFAKIFVFGAPDSFPAVIELDMKLRRDQARGRVEDEGD